MSEHELDRRAKQPATDRRIEAARRALQLSGRTVRTATTQPTERRDQQRKTG